MKTAGIGAKLRRESRALLRWVVHFPLFYKILVANTLLVVVGVTVVSWLTARHVEASAEHLVHWEFVVWVVAAGLIATVIMNYAILRAALQPIGALSRLAEALQRGELEARVHRPFFGDTDVDRLMVAVNGALDELGHYRERLRGLSSRVTAQLETERKNLARELHDDTAQALATLLVLERMLYREVATDQQRQAVADLRELTAVTLEGVRRLSVGLRPAILDDVGLVGALRWYVEEFSADTLPPVQLDLDDSLGRLSPEVELAFYRIGQEALSNVMRHAGASSVAVSLRRVGDRVTLTVADDGAGFDPGAPPQQGGREPLGLFTMRERAELVGGQLEVLSHPGVGTTVRAHLPWKQAAVEVGQGHGQDHSSITG